MRSAIRVYYGENDGVYPSTATAAADGDDITSEFSGQMMPKYLASIPTVKLGISSLANNDNVYCDINGGQNKGGWGYAGPATGSMIVSCTLTDTNGTVI